MFLIFIYLEAIAYFQMILWTKIAIYLLILHPLFILK
ncbi:hypothetical protein EVA_06374 [gut metagenome]|uniref:Uncharacterized protein n=1 Tax=gut metagenome TaxID=749906 RepID=J9GSC3_9ZZZZ